MKYSITHNPSYAMLNFTLSPGDSIKTESGAMVYMDEALDVETSFGSGFLSAISRKFLGGESMFLNTYTAREEVRLGVAPEFAGDIQHVELNNESLVLQKGAYLCSDAGIEIKTKFGGLKSLISREGVFLLEAAGTGNLFFNSYGAIIKKPVNGEFILDTGHLVAFEPTLQYKVQKTGGWKSTLFSGEGFTMRFEGTGNVWIQTRVRKGLVDWIMGFLPR
ncbi:MAG: TIGR00266 family protein [Leptospirales bacterium]